uniref:Uncharacterized protein n=1 Tax=Leersia perrieri TaxID=77586 RepID=A0A0D9X141_9ORYZ
MRAFPTPNRWNTGNPRSYMSTDEEDSNMVCAHALGLRVFLAKPTIFNSAVAGLNAVAAAALNAAGVNLNGAATKLNGATANLNGEAAAANLNAATGKRSDPNVTNETSVATRPDLASGRLLGRRWRRWPASAVSLVKSIYSYMTFQCETRTRF